MRAWRARCGGTSRLRGRVGQLGAVGDDAGLEGPLTSRPFKGGGIRPRLLYVKLGAVHSVQISDETFVAAGMRASALLSAIRPAGGGGGPICGCESSKIAVPWGSDDGQ